MASLIDSSRPLCTLTTYQRLLLVLVSGAGDASTAAAGSSGESFASAGAVAWGGVSSAAGSSAGVGSCWAVSGGTGGVTAGVGSWVETLSVMTHTLCLVSDQASTHHGLSSGGWAASRCSS